MQLSLELKAFLTRLLTSCGQGVFFTFYCPYNLLAVSSKSIAEQHEHNTEKMFCLKEVQKKSFEEKYETFMTICQNFEPVFRYFCMEKFLDPAVWFEKRLAYTRSVATSSIGNPVDLTY